VVLLEDTAYLGGVVLDTEVALDNLGHPGLGPDVAAKAEVLGSLSQEFQQLEPLLVGQLGPPTGRFAVAQGLGSLDPGPAEPLADGPLGHAQGFGDAVLGPAYLEQLPSPQAASFPPVGSLLGTQSCHTFQYASPSLGCLVLSSRVSKTNYEIRQDYVRALMRIAVDEERKIYDVLEEAIAEYLERHK
jgi:hypothetical protein